jgi:hypothetical protein
LGEKNEEQKNEEYCNIGNCTVAPLYCSAIVLSHPWQVASICGIGSKEIVTARKLCFTR